MPAVALTAIALGSDLYAVGVILYQMLSGSVPFRASTMSALAEMHQHLEPVLLDQLRPELPRKLTALVHQALHKEIMFRPASALEFRESLLRYAPTGSRTSLETAGTCAPGADAARP